MDLQHDRGTRNEREDSKHRGAAHRARAEVIEVLAEGLWTLICQGRGLAAGKFPALQKDATGSDDSTSDASCESSASV